MKRECPGGVRRRRGSGVGTRGISKGSPQPFEAGGVCLRSEQGRERPARDPSQARDDGVLPDSGGGDGSVRGNVQERDFAAVVRVGAEHHGAFFQGHALSYLSVPIRFRL